MDSVSNAKEEGKELGRIIEALERIEADLVQISGRVAAMEATYSTGKGAVMGIAVLGVAIGGAVGSKIESVFKLLF
jgi:hypothetical protein